MVFLKAFLTAAIFSAVAVLLHSWNQPYGLFLALLVIYMMMRRVARLSQSRSARSLTQLLPSLLAAVTWTVIAWVASTERNGGEFLIEGTTIGSSFLIGASALVALSLFSSPRASS